MNRTEHLGTLDKLKAESFAIYCDDRIAFIEDFKRAEQLSPVKLDAFIVVLCLQGKSSIYINGNLYDIGPNDMLICHPDIILEKSTMSMDTVFRSVCLSKSYMQQLTALGDSGNSWDAIMFLEKSPVLPLTDEEVTIFCQYYDLIRSKATGTPRSHQKQLISSLLQAFLYEFRDLLERFVKVNPSKYSAAERMFREFLDLLSSTYPKQRSVAYYASKLYITPKYLSSICKETSGRTATEIINRYVVKDIQYMLKQADKSIKDICNELEFPNLSFFGRYVRKHLGTSPKQWREQNM